MIQSLKDLKHLLKLCRQNGVTEITLDKVSIKLTEAPKDSQGSIEDTDDNLLSDFPDELLTPEELTFFANGGLPKDNPYRNQA